MANHPGISRVVPFEFKREETWIPFRTNDGPFWDLENQIGQVVAEGLRSWLKEQDEVGDEFGFRVFASESVPEDTVIVKNHEGRVVGKIINIGKGAENGKKEE